MCNLVTMSVTSPGPLKTIWKVLYLERKLIVYITIWNVTQWLCKDDRYQKSSFVRHIKILGSRSHTALDRDCYSSSPELFVPLFLNSPSSNGWNPLKILESRSRSLLKRTKTLWRSTFCKNLKQINILNYFLNIYRKINLMKQIL